MFGPFALAGWGLERMGPIGRIDETSWDPALILPRSAFILHPSGTQVLAPSRGAITSSPLG